MSCIRYDNLITKYRQNLPTSNFNIRLFISKVRLPIHPATFTTRLRRDLAAAVTHQRDEVDVDVHVVDGHRHLLRSYQRVDALGAEHVGEHLEKTLAEVRLVHLHRHRHWAKQTHRWARLSQAEGTGTEPSRDTAEPGRGHRHWAKQRHRWARQRAPALSQAQTPLSQAKGTGTEPSRHTAEPDWARQRAPALSQAETPLSQAEGTGTEPSRHTAEPDWDTTEPDREHRHWAKHTSLSQTEPDRAPALSQADTTEPDWARQTHRHWAKQTPLRKSEGTDYTETIRDMYNCILNYFLLNNQLINSPKIILD